MHGWLDDIVPVERAIRYAQQQRANLHLLDSGHTLNDRLPELVRIFDELLVRAAMLGAYRQALYRVEAEGDAIGLHVDRLDADADVRLANECGIGSNWALITACNPYGELLSPDDNADLAEKLRQRLRADGIPHLPASGRDPQAHWPAEASELLCDPAPGYAEALGRELGQNAILRGRLGAAPELVWLR